MEMQKSKVYVLPDSSGYIVRIDGGYTESNITAMQLQPDGSNKTDYVHNHVLRHVLTPAYGEVVSADAEGHATWTATYEVPKIYGKGSKTNLIMMYVVAFVTSGETGEVLQVVEAPLAPMIN